MFKDAFPDIGVLEGYPIMTMRQVKNGNANDLLHQYYSQLGTNLKSIRPYNCPGVLRCYHHGQWESMDPKVRIAAISLGQAMQECIRISGYRRPGDPETENLPVFNWNYQLQIKADQAQLVRQWFANHAEELQTLFREYRKRSIRWQELKYRA